VRATRHGYGVEGWGTGEIWTVDGAVVEHSFSVGAASAGGAAVTARSPKGTLESPSRTVAPDGAAEGDDFVPDLIRRIHSQLAGRPVDFGDVPLDLEWCTSFQRAVVDAARAVAWGDVVTYGELAALAGSPGAARAAGSVCAGNRFWLIVPCHRVVAANGLGGYGASGTTLKRRLLELEGVPVAAL
jgi:methylated-DNA-[protein]-cysteine S-methyltransferase